jgi:hypothetical protein
VRTFLIMVVVTSVSCKLQSVVLVENCDSVILIARCTSQQDLVVIG